MGAISKKDNMGISERYVRSMELLERAERSIPLGAQTFSKSKTQFPYGVSPYFIERGEGSHVFDADGNEYIDYIDALGAVTIGYCDPEVNAAIIEQLNKGTIFSLSSTLEMEVAERIIEMVPGAEKVRFGKNGSDATAGAVRVARAYTGRDHIFACGYHGWQDWYIGTTTRNKGVPKATQGLTHSFPYNDLPALEKMFQEYKDQVAAVIMEPMNVIEPAPGYLQGVKDLAHRHGALLIFDEVVTGFRLARGGAQEYFGVTPDLTSFGKGLANGLPLSAVAGRNEVMALMEEIFFSFTYGGDALALAAAKVVLDKIKKEPVLETMVDRGEVLKSGMTDLIAQHALGDVLQLLGHPSWSFLIVKDHAVADSFTIKTFFLQEMLRNGILTLGAFMLNYAHSEQDIEKTLQVFDGFLSRLRDGLESGALAGMLECEPIRPLFKVR